MTGSSFVSDNQDAFLYGTIEAFGSGTNCFEEDGAEADRIVEDGDYVGKVWETYTPYFEKIIG